MLACTKPLDGGELSSRKELSLQATTVHIPSLSIATTSESSLEVQTDKHWNRKWGNLSGRFQDAFSEDSARKHGVRASSVSGAIHEN